MAKGEDIKTKNQFLVRKGQFLFSRIDARNGAFGIATDEVDGAIVTNDFPVYDVDHSIVNPSYFALLTGTDHFFSYCRNFSSGTTNRQRINEEAFLSFKVPLPPLSEQGQMVAEYNDRISLSKEYEQKAEKYEQRIKQYLLSELGIKITQTQTLQGLQFVNYKNISRWAVDYLQNQSILNDIKAGKYQPVAFGELIIASQYGLSEKSGYERVGIPMLRMNNISRGELDLTDLKYVKLAPGKVGNMLLQDGDFLFNRTNSKELVGKAAVFDIEGDYVFASYLIRLRLNTKKVNVYFVNYLFDSPIIRQQIDMISRQITGLANVNLKELCGFLIPLPPLTVQEQVAVHVRELRGELKAVRADAEWSRREAKSTFEAKVFEG